MSLERQRSEPTIQGSGSGYTEMNTETSPLPLPGQDTPSASLLRRSLSDITINQFKRANFHSDLSVLIISGNPSPDDIKEAWEAIKFEYASVIKTDNSEYLIKLQADIGELRAHIDMVNICATTVELRIKSGTPVSPKVFDVLINEGYDIDPDETDPATIRRQMARIISQCKTKIHDLEDLVTTYEKAVTSDDVKPQTEDQFNQNLAMLRKFMGYRINPNEYSMEEYATDYNLLLAQVKKAKKKDEQ